MSGEFLGFSRGMIDFLWELRMNNHKEWMEQNRNRYSQELKIPMEEFGAELARQMETVGYGSNIQPIHSRMNRDIRFAKDKSPYRDKKWVVFRFEQDKSAWKDKPTFFFEVFPEGYRYGMGFYQAPVAYMRGFRKKIETNPQQMKRIATVLEQQSCFQLEGECYKRKMGESSEPLLQQWYQRKTFAFVAGQGVEEGLFSPELPQKIAKDYLILKEFYLFLKGIIPE